MNSDELLMIDENEVDDMPSRDVNEITQQIIGCAYKVSNSLGIDFVEKVYENALAHILRKDGLIVAQQHPVKVTFEGVVVGEFFADLLVEQRVLVELKAVSALMQEHTAQALNYLRATGLEGGLSSDKLRKAESGNQVPPSFGVLEV